jgi:hypothetical protein
MTEMIHQQYLDVENVLDKLQQLSLFNNSSKIKSTSHQNNISILNMSPNQRQPKPSCTCHFAHQRKAKATHIMVNMKSTIYHSKYSIIWMKTPELIVFILKLPQFVFFQTHVLFHVYISNKNKSIIVDSKRTKTKIHSVNSTVRTRT